jgi:hypothetical protein
MSTSGKGAVSLYSFERLGLWRWLLRECVRANPFYVISAALVSYGILEVVTKIDPQVGKAGGVLLAAGVVHLYELCLLAVAGIVLWQRRECEAVGRDTHGLLMTAALFLSAGFLALDEVMDLYPGWAPYWIGAALALAVVKLTCYGRMPGLYMPARYRWLAVLLLAGHSVSALLGRPAIDGELSRESARALGWLAAWLPWMPVFCLLAWELKRTRGPRPDILQTRWTGFWLLGLTGTVGVVHGFAADWVFDRGMDPTWVLPAIVWLAAMLLITRFHFVPHWDRWHFVLAAIPFALVQWLWSERNPLRSNDETALWIALAVQTGLAASLAYASLAWATGHKAFLLGLAWPVGAPAWAALNPYRSAIPHFRGLLVTALGFLTLLGGMVLSLLRERALNALDAAWAPLVTRRPAPPWFETPRPAEPPDPPREPKDGV